MGAYWLRAHGYGLTGWRIWFAAVVGPWCWPAWYVAPRWKRDKWHRIACDSDTCASCAAYYGCLSGVEGDASPSGS